MTTGTTTINEKSICLEFYSNEQRPTRCIHAILENSVIRPRAFNSSLHIISDRLQYFYDREGTRELVYHHRYRINVRLQRRKGYIPLKGSVEGWPVAYDNASRTLRSSQSQIVKREREDGGRDKERGVRLT